MDTAVGEVDLSMMDEAMLNQNFTMPIDQKIARIGELTTMITLISPLPAFVSCHKTSFEKNKQLAQISFNFLLAVWVTNLVWLAYSIKIMNMDLIVINALGTFIATCFLSIYLYVKAKVSRLTLHLVRLVIGIIFGIAVSSTLTNAFTNGLIATSMSMS